MSVVLKCVDEIRSGEKLQVAVRKWAKLSEYTVRKFNQIVRWILTDEWITSRKRNNYRYADNKKTVKKVNYLTIKW